VAEVEDAELEALVASAATGDAGAWQALWQALEPRLGGLVRRPRVTGRLCRNEDDCRNIVVEVMARLCDDDFRRLKMYLATRADNPQLAFVPWVLVVAKRTAIDYMRGHGEYLDRRGSRNPDSAPGAWVRLGTLPSDSRLDGARPAVTNHGAAMKMLRYAYKELPKDQLEAFELWILHTGFDEISTQLGLGGAKQAERLVRAALERLRRKFRDRSNES
jgi:DNA-directed RNA polymerase specialized sigma24 family protein